MSDRIWNRSLTITAAGVAAISAFSLWLAFGNTGNLAARLLSFAIIPVLAAAVTSYSLRIVRFHYFLIKSGVPLSLRATALIQAVGFALSVTPAHMGEVFKLHLIRERSGTPVVQSAPLLLLDRLTEGGGFLVLATLSALALPALRPYMPKASVTLLALATAAAFGLLVRTKRIDLSGLLSRLPGRSLRERFGPHMVTLWRGLEASFGPKQILGGLALSALARFADGIVLLLAARLLGLDLSLPAAVFILAVSGLAGGISLLPAGAGAVETTMTGLLVVSGASLGNALSITLIARLATLWIWVALGLALAFLMRFPASKQTRRMELDEQAMGSVD